MKSEAQHENCTGSIPKELGALSKLDTLLINDNPLEGEDVKESNIESFSLPANTDDTVSPCDGPTSHRSRHARVEPLERSARLPAGRKFVSQKGAKELPTAVCVVVVSFPIRRKQHLDQFSPLEKRPFGAGSDSGSIYLGPFILSFVN